MQTGQLTQGRWLEPVSWVLILHLLVGTSCVTMVVPLYLSVLNCLTYQMWITTSSNCPVIPTFLRTSNCPVIFCVPSQAGSLPGRVQRR
jgi:hypothetical protein